MDLEQQRSQQIDILTAALSQCAPLNPNSVLDKPIGSLGLTPKADHILKDEKILLVRDLVAITEQELLKAPFMGRRSLNDIKEALAAVGLTLGMKLPEPQAEHRSRLPAKPIHGISEEFAGEILTSGAVLHFPTDKQATNFASVARPPASDDLEIASFHVKLLPVQNGGEGKTYPVYVSDEALSKLTTPENLQKLASVQQAIGVAAARG